MREIVLSGKKRQKSFTGWSNMGNAGSMDQHTDFRGHNMPLKLPMPEPGELEERFATVLVRKKQHFICLFFVPSMLRCPGSGQLCVG